MKETIEQRMSLVRGFTSGFDYLRLILALAVLLWHSVVMTRGMKPALELSAAGLGWLTFPILPMFFALSGFLVASSLQRTPSLLKFLWLRVIRIMPALTVEVMLSAILLGTFFTTLSWQEYFSSPVLVQYFKNIYGDIHYHLPGVFESNPLSGIVNTSLWTVPFELECYAVLACLALVRLTKFPRVLLCLFLVATLLKSGSTYIWGVAENIPSNAGGRQLVLFFLAGLIVNLNRRTIPYESKYFVIAVVASLVMMKNGHFVYLAPLPVAYVTVWLGLLNPPKIPVVMAGDYSYGIYLYAAPIQQSVYYLFDAGKYWAGNVLLTLALVSAFAAFSWNLVEKPLLRLRNLF